MCLAPENTGVCAWRRVANPDFVGTIGEIVTSSGYEAVMTDVRWPVVRDEDGSKVQMTLAGYSRFRGSPPRAIEAALALFARTVDELEKLID